MQNENSIDRIAQAVANANASNHQVAPQFLGLLATLKEEKANEDFTLKHGVQHASTRDIEDETNGWKPSEEIDFDQDENLVDMDSVSVTMREVFES